MSSKQDIPISLVIASAALIPEATSAGTIRSYSTQSVKATSQISMWYDCLVGSPAYATKRTV